MLANKEDGTQKPFRPGHAYALAMLAETWERLWPLLVPGLLVFLAYAIVSWFGLWQVLPDSTRIAGGVLFLVALAASLWPLRSFSLPNRQQLLHRIERASELRDRPVTAQVDTPSGAMDPFAEALWTEHRRRMKARLGDLSPGTPKPDGNRFDRFALRAMVPLIAFIAWGYSLGPEGGRLTDAFSKRIDIERALSRLDAWVAPPTYTGRPPVYLSRASATQTGDPAGAAGSATTVIEGSEFHLRYVGSETVIAGLRTDSGFVPFEPSEASGAEGAPPAGTIGPQTFSGVLEGSGTVEFLAEEQLVASWPIEVLADRAPSIRFEEPPSPSLNGTLQLTYSVEDDFGVVSARALISPAIQPSPDARPLVEAPEVQLPLPRARAKTGTAKVNRDLSSHPWAGSEVDIVLEATDDPGQTGVSAPMRMTLPGRNFNNPLALALVEQRRILATDANEAPRAASLLDAVSQFPEEFDINPQAYLAMRTAYRMIVSAKNDDRLRESLDLLWETALALELGNLSEVERRLREAQEKLSEALENGASDEEIAKLMEELREAMNEYMEQLARELAQNPARNNPMQPPSNMQTLTQRDLERMMDRIEDLARSGSRDAARELLSELQRMMDNLMAGRHQQQRQAEGNQLNQTLDKLAELMQRQQRLMDETFSMQRRDPGNPQNGQQGQQEGGQQPMTPEEFAEALRQLQESQRQLQQDLEALGKELDELGINPSEEFGEAGREMGEAGENLGQGNPGGAAGDQGQALQALRQGVQSMMQQMAGDRNQGGQQQGDAGQAGQDQRRTDPLGRSTEANGRFSDETTRIPNEIDAQRAREILDAIRRRLADPLRPLIERDYLERLLQGRQ